MANQMESKVALIEQVFRNAQPPEQNVFGARFREPEWLEALLRVLPQDMHRELVTCIAEDRKVFGDKYQKWLSPALQAVERGSGSIKVSHKAVASYLLHNEEELSACVKALMVHREDSEKFRNWLRAIADADADENLERYL